MRYKNLMAIAIYLAGLIPVKAQNTFELKSMVMLNKVPKKGFVLNVNGKKTETDQGGIFGIGLHNNTTYVLITLEDNTYSILYPPDGHLPIPKNPTEIPVIYLGTKDDYRQLNELITLTKKIDKLSINETQERKSLGIEINNLKKILLEKNFQECDLERTTFQENRLQDGRDRYFGEISQNLNNYYDKANTLTLKLKNSTPSLYGNSVQSMTLYEAVFEYNDAYKKISLLQKIYEKAISDYWLDDSLKAEFNILMAYVTDTANSRIIDTFNPTLNDIRGYCCCRKRDEKLEQAIKQRIDKSVESIEVLISDLKKRNDYFQDALKAK